MNDRPQDPGEDRLLPGEAGSVESNDIREMRRWVEVYGELYGFKHELLEEIEEQTRRVSPPGAFELANDMSLIENEASRLHRRLQYWQKRLEEASGS
jgi:hypothetical protein